MDYIADVNAGMAKTASYMLVSIGVVYGVIVIIYNTSRLDWDLYSNLLFEGLGHTLEPIFVACLLRMTPKRFVEWTMVGAEMFLGCGLMISNVFRLRRQFPTFEIPDVAANVIWENCDYDLAIHARDCLLGCVLLFFRAICCNLFRVRTKLAWIVPVCESILFALVLFSPAQRLDDGGLTPVLFVIVTSASFGIFIANRAGERNHRELWALLRMKDEESVWQQELLHLVFPVVLHVKQGSLMPDDAFKQHLEWIC